MEKLTCLRKRFQIGYKNYYSFLRIINDNLLCLPMKELTLSIGK